MRLSATPEALEVGRNEFGEAVGFGVEGVVVERTVGLAAIEVAEDG